MFKYQQIHNITHYYNILNNILHNINKILTTITQYYKHINTILQHIRKIFQNITQYYHISK